jgi:hypothetical protein
VPASWISCFDCRIASRPGREHGCVQSGFDEVAHYRLVCPPRCKKIQSLAPRSRCPRRLRSVCPSPVGDRSACLRGRPNGA